MIGKATLPQEATLGVGQGQLDELGDRPGIGRLVSRFAILLLDTNHKIGRQVVSNTALLGRCFGNRAVF
jgi:hypothetical protein